MSDSESNEPSTAGRDYADRLERLSSARWKQVLNVQAPYRADLRRLQLGATLDIGCGTGRNLVSLPKGSVGVDHNPFSIETARAQGAEAYTVEEFFADPALCVPGRFDSALIAHVVEHLTPADARRRIVGSYLPFVRPGGRFVFITPQERGYASDATHITFTDLDGLESLAGDLGLITEPTLLVSVPPTDRQGVANTTSSTSSQGCLNSPDAQRSACSCQTFSAVSRQVNARARSRPAMRSRSASAGSPSTASTASATSPAKSSPSTATPMLEPADCSVRPGVDA